MKPLQHQSGGKGNVYQHTKTGYREDIGIVLRSNWEANFARILKLYEIDFDFEPTVFAFPIKRGTKAYTPDFYIKEKNIWVEIKGFLDDKSKVKLKRFKRYYEKEFNNLFFIISKFNSDAKDFAEELGIKNIIFYEDIRSFYASKILNWEGK